jgi:hypothetical protein
MHAPQSEPPPRHPAFQRPAGIQSGYNPPTGDDTEFRRTWEKKFGHRWVKRGARYYPAGTPPEAMTNRRDSYRGRRG